MAISSSIRVPVVKPKPPVVIKQSVLGYELDSDQNVYVNYLCPSILAALFYILYYACDLAVSYRHFTLENPIWASLTLLFMYTPVLGCFIVTISSWELWPELEGCSIKNAKWASLKISQHVFFPIWCMWRYAEKIFWSIEALRSPDEEERDANLKTVNDPRTIELYLFLQGYLHAVPQIFLQLHILMRYVSGLDAQTMGIQGASIILNLVKMAMTTTIYQRFKKQKVGGKNYPWFKYYKQEICPSVDEIDAVPSSSLLPPPSTTAAINQQQRSSDSSSISSNKRKSNPIIYCHNNNEFKIRESLKLQAIEEAIINNLEDGEDDLEEGVYEEIGFNPNLSNRRRSSDFYLPPVDQKQESTLIKRVVKNQNSVQVQEDLVDIPRRVIDITALPEDDITGKFVSFLWWFCFLTGRLLAISVFAFFYPTQIYWILANHFILTIAFLLYDAQALEVRRRKVIFFIYVGLVYLFCLIEFKIKFKKAKFWYYGFFTITYIENFAMTFSWYFLNLDFILTDEWWFHYLFFVIMISSVMSLLSMLTYLRVNKPKSVAVEEKHVPVGLPPLPIYPENQSKFSFIRNIFRKPTI